MNRQVAWVKEEVIGKAKQGTSTFIYSLQGDESRKNLSLVVSSGDNPDEVRVREKCQIPQDGEITSVILVSHTNGETKMIHDNNFIKKIKLWKQYEKTEDSFVLNGDYKWISVYNCYDKCPIGLFEYDLLKLQNKVFICKDRVHWDFGGDNWIASDLYIPRDTEVPIIDALFEEYEN